MTLSAQTRILVTHGVSFLPFVDEIVVLVDGVVSEVGSYKSLRASKGAFSEFLDTYAKDQNNRTQSESGNRRRLCRHFSVHCSAQTEYSGEITTMHWISNTPHV